jgi:hypothetical protein
MRKGGGEDTNFSNWHEVNYGLIKVAEIEGDINRRLAIIPVLGKHQMDFIFFIR